MKIELPDFITDDAPVVPGTEGIAFQNNRDFGDALSEAISTIRKRGVKKNDRLEEISAVIEKYTNIPTKLRAVNAINAWVYPATVDKDHVFYDEYKEWLDAKTMKKELEGDSAAFLKKEKILRGGVDLTSGKVIGDFKKLNIRMAYSELFFRANSPFSPGQVAAIILHETGHAFHLYEFLVRTSTTNYIMEELASRLQGVVSKENRVAIVKEAERAGYKVDADGLVNAKSADVVRVIVLRDAFEESKHELGENIYDIRGFEMLADQYAIRMGYGKELSTGLAVLYKEFGISLERPMIAAFFAWALEIAAYVVTSGVFFLLFAILYQPDTTYDTDKKRQDVIIQQMRRALKEDIPDEDKRDILRSLKTLEDLWGRFKDYPMLIEYVWRVLPWGKGKATSMRIQQELEKLANNRMAEAIAHIETGTTV